jgi:tRNA A-37 threonylcarbamoyl transferase component Bud32/tetratricopeptide (TPR) repeat protein
VNRLKTALTDRYAIEREIGRGGMATVYLAHDVRHDRKVALKVLHPELTASLGAERFLHEIKTTARLNHPHILALHDSGEADGFLFYVMPYVEGESLRDRLARERQLPLEDALQITSEVADALSYAHSHGIIHRDIKPENILLESGHAVVADFGIARAVSVGGADQRLTMSGFAVGTPAYMSPEQASGNEQLDARSDIYALGSVLYEMLAGEPPHTGPTPQAILARQLSGEVRSIRPLRSTVTPALEAAIRQALAPSAADRFTTASEFATALRGRGVAPRRSSAVLALVVSRRSLRTVLTTALVVLGLVGVFVVARNILTVPQARAGERPATLAVFPFRATGPDAGSLGEGVADLLAATIDGTVGMTVADPGGLWRPLRRGEGALRVPDLDEAVRLTQEAEVPTLVLGALTAVGGRLDMSARVYQDDGSLLATLTASAPVESLPHLINRLAIDVVSEVWVRDTLPTVPVIERFATQSVDALQAYLEAKALKRRGLYQEAEQAIRRAVELDSTFALAHMELFDIRSIVLYLNSQPFVGLREIIDRAMRHRDRLTPRNRMRVEALRAMDETDGVRAASLYERILEVDSLDIDALHGLAFAYLRDGWQMAKTIDDIIGAYHRAAEVDSASIMAQSSLAWLTILQNDPDAVELAVARLEALDTLGAIVAGRLGALRLVQALPVDRDSMLRALTATPAPVVFTTLRDLRTLRPQLAERYVDELLVDTMPVFHQRLGAGARTQLWMAEGKVTASDSVLRTGELDRIRQTVNRFFASSALLGVGDSTAAARAVLEMTAFAPADSLEAYLDAKQDVWATGWAVGAYHAAFGDTAEARSWQAALAALPRRDTPWDWTGALAADIEARLAVRRGEVEVALREAQRAYDLWSLHSGYVGEADPEPAMRFHLAQILRETGASDQAAALFRSFAPPHTWMGFFTARAAYEVAEIALAEGRDDEAIRYFQMAERLWELGEPEVVGPWLARVRDGLAQLRAG